MVVDKANRHLSPKAIAPSQRTKHVASDRGWGSRSMGQSRSEHDQSDYQFRSEAWGVQGPERSNEAMWKQFLSPWRVVQTMEILNLRMNADQNLKLIDCDGQVLYAGEAVQETGMVLLCHSLVPDFTAWSPTSEGAHCGAKGRSPTGTSCTSIT